MNPMNVAVVLTALVASARCEGFHNGPVTFGSDLAHPNGAKSYATITLGASGAVNTNAVPKSSSVSTSEQTVTLSQPQQITIQRAEPNVQYVQAPAPQISVFRSAPQVSYIQSAAPQVSVLRSAAPQVSLIQGAAPTVSITQSRPSIAVTGGVGYSAGPASHGYTVNAPGLTKTATFGYTSGSSLAVSQPRTVTVSQTPRYQVEVPQQQIQLVQERSPQYSIVQAPRVSVIERQAPRISVVQAPAPQIRIQQAPAPQIRIQQQRVAVSGPATSHGYTVNAPGLTKTATFGYSSGGTTITQSAPRITVAQQQPSRVQVRVGQPQFSYVQAPAPQIRIQQAPAPEIRVRQAPAARIRVEQPRVSVSGPATSHGYTVNAPGLTKTATFGYPSGGVSISQASPRVTVQQAPRVQVRVAQPQLQFVQAPAPQIRYQQAPAPQIRIQQAPAPQYRIQQAPAPQLQVLQAPAPQINVVQAPARRVQVQQSRVSVSGPATSHGYTVNAPGLTKTATFGYPSGGVSVTQEAPRVTVSETPKVQVRVAQPQVQYVHAEAPQVHVVEAPQPRLSLVHSPAPQVSLLHHTVSPVSTLTYGAPQISVIKTQQPQYQIIPASAPQISLVRSVQPQVQVVEAQPEVKTIQYEAPRISATVSGFAAPNVRQQQFNTPSHGYQVSAPGFTKHKTFAGPSVYGTHQDSGISGASGIGYVDFSLRKENKSSA